MMTGSHYGCKPFHSVNVTNDGNMTLHFAYTVYDSLGCSITGTPNEVNISQVSGQISADVSRTNPTDNSDLRVK